MADVPPAVVPPAVPLTLGTAGHIDHGKTVLVEALTGTNTDRLAEERRRGISIELGFAELELPSGRRLSVVDVPGHERLVRTMVSGASGIDLFLLVVAADDGVMPQTREHVAVLRALAVEPGVIAVTKADLASPDAVEGAASAARALVPGAPVMAASGVTGAGVEELRRALDAVAARVERARVAAGSRDEPAVLHVDRVFSVHGAGTIVTGTLRSGAIGQGDRLEVLPAGRPARVRSVQTHGRAVERAQAGGRVAVNLSGIRRSEVARGDVLASAEAGLEPSYRLDVQLELDREAAPLAGQRVQVHHGTRDAPARVVELGDGRAQLRLSSSLIARTGDRLVLRRIAPPDTLGGGTVLDPRPRRHGPGRGHEPEAARADPGARGGETRRRPPLDRDALLVLALLRADGDEPRGPDAVAERLGLERRAVDRALAGLVAAGRAVRLRAGVHYPTESLAELRERALALASERGEITLAELRDALGTSRRYALALLEHLDSTGLTARRGESHVLRRL